MGAFTPPLRESFFRSFAFALESRAFREIEESFFAEEDV